MDYSSNIQCTENGEVDVSDAEGMRQLVRLTAFPEEDVQREAVWALAILASNSCMYIQITNIKRTRLHYNII